MDGKWKCNDINAFFIIDSNEGILHCILQYILQGMSKGRKIVNLF